MVEERGRAFENYRLDGNSSLFSRLKSNCTLNRARSLINTVCTGSQGDITLLACF